MLDVTVTPNHLICGRNTNKKCFDNNVTTDFDYKGVRNSFAHLKLVLQELSNRFENEYISPLKQCHIYNNKRYNNSTDDLINDVVLAKQKKTPRIKWKKAKIIDVIKGINNHIRGLQLKVFQPSLNQTFTISDQSTVKNITIQNYMWQWNQVSRGEGGGGGVKKVICIEIDDFSLFMKRRNLIEF